MPTLRGIPFTEVFEAGSMNLTIGRETDKLASVTIGIRVFDVPWTQRMDFVEALLGTNFAFDQVIINFRRAQKFPDFEVLKCNKVDIKGIGEPSQDINGIIIYEKARIVATFVEEEEEDNDLEKVLRSEELNFSVEAMQIPEHSVIWDVSDGGNGVDRVNAPMNILIPTIDHIFTINEIKKLPKQKLINTIGKVNNSVFPRNPPVNRKDIEGEPAPVGTVLFVGASSRKITTVEGEQPYQLTLTFRQRIIPWNFFWRPDKATRPSTDGAPLAGTKFFKVDPTPYPEANLFQLLKQVSPPVPLAP